MARTPSAATVTVPIVDMTLGDAADGVRAACLETGFFYIVGHGVPAALVDAQFRWAAQLFGLDAAEKLAISSTHSPSGNGYDPIRSQILEKGKLADLKESVHFGPELPDDHPLVRRGLPRYGGNQWPASLPGLRDQTLAYFDAMIGLGGRLMRLLARSLALDPAYFAPFHRQPMADLRMLHYPPSQIGQTSSGQLGAGAHTDWGGLTILAQDDVGGLEVLTAGGWCAAPPVEGAFVVNLGQLMTRWTNDLYRANVHRVVAMTIDRHRYSIPFFFNPDYDAQIECLPGCLTAGDEPRWSPCSAGEHIEEMRRAALAPVHVGDSPSVGGRL